MTKLTFSSDKLLLTDVSLEDFGEYYSVTKVTLAHSTRTLNEPPSGMSVEVEVPFEALTHITNPGAKFSVTVEIEVPE